MKTPRAMKTYRRAALAAALGGALLALTGCAKLEARSALNKGVTAYKAAQFNEATEFFQQAIKLDPTFINARLYLATAYESQFVPNSSSSENMRLGDQAIAVYKQVLAMQPNNVNAVAGIAHMYYDMKQLDQARTWNEKQIQLEPNNPAPYYFIGVIDWMQAFQPDSDLRKQLKTVDATKPLLPAKATRQDVRACEDLAKTSMPIIQDGLKALDKAMSLRKNYADAMTYANLLDRQKADMECTDRAATTQDLEAANDWVTKSLDARKMEAAAAAQAARNGGGAAAASAQ